MNGVDEGRTASSVFQHLQVLLEWFLLGQVLVSSNAEQNLKPWVATLQRGNLSVLTLAGVEIQLLVQRTDLVGCDIESGISVDQVGTKWQCKLNVRRSYFPQV